MRFKIACILAVAVGGCETPGTTPAMRGLHSLHEPVLTRSSVAYNAGAQDGYLTPDELARLDGWFRSMELRYGDTIHLDAGYPEAAREQVTQLAGRYGMMVSSAAPVTAGAVAPGFMRVIVSRTRAEVPGCPNWSAPSQPNYGNATMSNFGCGVNANLAAQVANAEDLFRGRSGPAASDGVAGAKAVQMYRDWPLTAVRPGQELRPLLGNATAVTRGEEIR